MPLPLQKLLEKHVAVDEKERADLETMRRYARTLKTPFSRAEAEAHFTGSAVLVDTAGEHVCLVHHRKLSRWLQPGGHAEEADGGDMTATALREAWEESGLEVELHPLLSGPLDVDVHGIPGKGGEPSHLHLDVRFLVRAKGSDVLAHDPLESHGAKWLTWTDAKAGAASEPAMLRMLEKAERVVRGVVG